jgi:hypothetical protein
MLLMEIKLELVKMLDGKDDEILFIWKLWRKMR